MDACTVMTFPSADASAFWNRPSLPASSKYFRLPGRICWSSVMTTLPSLSVVETTWGKSTTLSLWYASRSMQRATRSATSFFRSGWMSTVSPRSMFTTDSA